MHQVMKANMGGFRGMVKSKSVSEREDRRLTDSPQRKAESMVEREESKANGAPTKSSTGSKGFSGPMNGKGSSGGGFGGFGGFIRSGSIDQRRPVSPLFSRSASSSPYSKRSDEKKSAQKSSSGSGSSTTSVPKSRSAGMPRGSSIASPLKKGNKSHSIDNSSPGQRDGKPPPGRSLLSHSDDARKEASRFGLQSKSGSVKERARPKTPEPAQSRTRNGDARSKTPDPSHMRCSSTSESAAAYKGFASSAAVGTGSIGEAGAGLRSLSMAGRSSSATSANRLRTRSNLTNNSDPSKRDVALGSLEALTKSAEGHLEKIKAGTPEEQAEAAEALRTMAKLGARQAKAVVAAGSVGPLTALLKSEVPIAVEHAVTTLLNIAIDEKVRLMLTAEVDFYTSVTHVLSSGTPQARSNAAAALCCVSTLPGAREAIVGAGALPGLLSLLREGEGEFKRDSANCLLSLCISRETRLPIAKSGLVTVLVDLLQDPAFDCDEQAAGIFAALSRIPEGRDALIHEGAIPPLAELLECGGTEGCKEYAVTALVGLAVNSKACLVAIDELGLATSLDVLSRTGSQSAQGKAKGLLELLSNGLQAA